jgi:phenylacetate-CoA ligase
MELSVIVPCYNEEHNIPELVERIQKVFKKRDITGEIILVNDGSQDNTHSVIDAQSKKYNNVIAVHHIQNKGIAEAWKSGLKNSTGELVCIIDADLQYQPEDIYRLYREIKFYNVDIVQGYRSHIGRLKDSRFILSKGLNFLLNILMDMKAKDNKSGFIICAREVLEDILRYKYKYRYFQTFITVAAKAKGYMIKEIEVLFESRILGKSFMSLFPVKVIFWCLIDIIKAFFEFRIFDKKQTDLEIFLKNNIVQTKNKPISIWRKIFFKIYIALMPIHHWMISSNAGKYYYELKQSQWLSAEKIREYQLIRLKKLVNHAYKHVPYYREKFDKLGIKPHDIKTLEDIIKLPTLTKKDIKENLYFDLLSDNHDKRKIMKISTSGSTGEPLTCYVDKEQLEMRWAATLRGQEWAGYQFLDKNILLWHQNIGMSTSQIIRERLNAFLLRRKFIPAFEISDENIKKFISSIIKYKPTFIEGYAESLNLLASYIKNNKITHINLKGIISSAQTLSTNSRQIIEGQFNCKVFDKYGSREFSGIAYECEAHNGHHIVAENYIVEILKDGMPVEPGQMGEVVITDLNNYCTPFIRYRIGDLAIAMDKKCSCGRGLPLIGEIKGRIQAIIIGTKKQYLPGTFFAHFLKDYDYAIRQFQVIQTQLGSITLKIIKGSRYTDAVLNEVLKTLKHYLGNDMIIDVEFVDKIPLGKTGKHHHSISKLNIDFQQGVE